MDNSLDTIGQDLDEARAKLQAAREALQAAPQAAPAVISVPNAEIHPSGTRAQSGFDIGPAGCFGSGSSSPDETIIV